MDERSRTESGNGRPGLAVITSILCGPVALITIPAFWWLGFTLTEAAVLTIFVQYVIFLVVMMIGFYRSSGDELDALYSETPKSMTIPNSQIWRSYSHDRGVSPRIALIAENSVQARQIARSGSADRP